MENENKKIKKEEDNNEEKKYIGTPMSSKDIGTNGPIRGRFYTKKQPVGEYDTKKDIIRNVDPRVMLELGYALATKKKNIRLFLCSIWPMGHCTTSQSSCMIKNCLCSPISFLAQRIIIGL